MVVMEIWADADGNTVSERTFLAEYDADVDAYRGRVVLTNDINKAMRFADFQDMMACWQRVSKTVPLRPDGRPNRPLSAFSITATTVD